MILSYNACVVKIYTKTNSIAHFRIKMIAFYFESAPAYYNAAVVAVNLKVVGLPPGSNPTILCYNAGVQHYE
jgi:hypothetical protein